LDAVQDLEKRQVGLLIRLSKTNPKLPMAGGNEPEEEFQSLHAFSLLDRKLKYTQRQGLQP